MLFKLLVVVVVALDSLVDNNSKISAHFEGIFCRLLSTSYARLYFLSMQSLKKFCKNIFVFFLLLNR